MNIVYVLTLNRTVLGVYSQRSEAERQARKFNGVKAEVTRVQVDRPA